VRQFVPMNDDLLYQPDALPGPLVPYRCGVPCWHQLQTQPTADSKRDLDNAARAHDVRDSEAVTA